MASKRRIRRIERAKQCEGKRQFHSILAAQINAKKIHSRTGKMRPYKCKFCGKFHLGHTPVWIENIIESKKDSLYS